jgi:hypothetical protein
MDSRIRGNDEVYGFSLLYNPNVNSNECPIVSMKKPAKLDVKWRIC